MRGLEDRFVPILLKKEVQEKLLPRELGVSPIIKAPFCRILPNSFIMDGPKYGGPTGGLDDIYPMTSSNNSVYNVTTRFTLLSERRHDG
jgi:hypothetical protein